MRDRNAILAEHKKNYNIMNTKRSEAYAAVFTAKSTLEGGKHMTDQKYSEFCKKIDGFQKINVPDADSFEEAQKIYDELFKPWCIILALHREKSLCWDIKNVQEFDCILRTNEYVGEEYFIWYPTDAEVQRLSEKATSEVVA
jgi:hypothetical protein